MLNPHCLLCLVYSINIGWENILKMFFFKFSLHNHLLIHHNHNFARYTCTGINAFFNIRTPISYAIRKYIPTTQETERYICTLYIYAPCLYLHPVQCLYLLPVYICTCTVLADLLVSSCWTLGQALHCNPSILRLEICQKIYTTEDFRVKNLHRKCVIFDIC